MFSLRYAHDNNSMAGAAVAWLGREACVCRIQRTSQLYNISYYASTVAIALSVLFYVSYVPSLFLKSWLLVSCVYFEELFEELGVESI